MCASNCCARRQSAGSQRLRTSLPLQHFSPPERRTVLPGPPCWWMAGSRSITNPAGIGRIARLSTIRCGYRAGEHLRSTSVAKINWDRVQAGLQRDRHRIVWRPYGAPTIGDLEYTALHDAPISAPWVLPDRLIVSVAITGAFFRPPQNPKQPITVEQIRESA